MTRSPSLPNRLGHASPGVFCRTACSAGGRNRLRSSPCTPGCSCLPFAAFAPSVYVMPGWHLYRCICPVPPFLSKCEIPRRRLFLPLFIGTTLHTPPPHSQHDWPLRRSSLKPYHSGPHLPPPLPKAVYVAFCSLAFSLSRYATVRPLRLVFPPSLTVCCRFIPPNSIVLIIPTITPTPPDRPGRVCGHCSRILIPSSSLSILLLRPPPRSSTGLGPFRSHLPDFLFLRAPSPHRRF